MKNIYSLGLIIVLIMILCSGCILPDGEPLTTESVTKQVQERYGAGKVKVKQLDKKTWEISPTDYPDIKYTIKQKIGHGGVIPVPAYTDDDNRMKVLGKIVLPKFFSRKEIENIEFSDSIIKYKCNVKNDQDVEVLCSKLQAMCEYMNENYGPVVKDAYVTACFKEPRGVVPVVAKYKKPAMRDKISKSKIISYLDSKYGSGTYTFRKVPSDEVSHEGEVEVKLNDYPDMPFYLATSTKPGKRGQLTDTLYIDMIYNLAFNFPASEYDSSSYLEVKGEENLDGERYYGVLLRRYFKWGDETGVIENMQVTRKALRSYLDQYPVVNYSDYPENKHAVKTPICMKISVQF